MALGSTQLVTELGIFTREERWPVRRVYKPTPFMCRLPGYLRASTCGKPHGLSRPVQGLFDVKEYKWNKLLGVTI